MEQIVSPELSQPITTQPPSSDSIDPSQIDATFSKTCIDLISAPLNPKILHVSDEFFAAASNLLTPTPPIRRPGVYVPTGAWYDGWESRRHNRLEADAVVLRIGPAGGKVRGVEIDTAFFTGNHAPEVSVEGAYEPEDEGADEKVKSEAYPGWMEILSRRECGPSQRHAWRVSPKSKEGGNGDAEQVITHVRLRMYPDGGIARFRLYGAAVPVWTPAATASASAGGSGPVVELSSALNGGLAVAWSDQHFGSVRNLLLPGRGKDMGDGWETKRSRGGHEDWAVVSLGARGRLARVVVDTMHFRGNFPREVRVEGCDVGEQAWTAERDGAQGVGAEELSERVWEKAEWVTLVPNRAMSADEEATVAVEEMGGDVAKSVFSHVRLFMIPDGGVKRLRVFGTRVET